MINNQQKFFLYVRKSTDVEDKQILSIEAQLAELKAFAKREGIKITVLTKGGGAENCSAIKMFAPTSSKEEIDKFILETVEAAGANACPPIIVGVGIGGSFDYAPILAKKALLRSVGHNHSQHDVAAWERELVFKINKTGIGPMGLGGKVTALGVSIEKHPCHISSLPVAVNIECHAHRAREASI